MISSRGVIYLRKLKATEKHLPNVTLHHTYSFCSCCPNKRSHSNTVLVAVMDFYSLSDITKLHWCLDQFCKNELRHVCLCLSHKVDYTWADSEL